MLHTIAWCKIKHYSCTLKLVIMKKIITTTIFFLVITVASFAQQINPQVQHQASNAEFAKKLLAQSKSQRTISTVLVISGVALVCIGAGLSLRGFGDWSNSSSKGDPGGGALAITGGCAIAAGIPLAYVVKHNKKKAELLLQNDKALPATSFTQGRVYSIGVQINFNCK